MSARATDEAMLVIIRACRQRMLDVLLPAIEAVADDLIAEGHAEVLVCQAQVSAAGELLGHAILDNCNPEDAVELWRHTADIVGKFVVQNAAAEAGARAGLVLKRFDWRDFS